MSIKTLQKRAGDIEYRVEIDYDHFAESPREYSEWSYLCIRKHRNYTFPNELDFDFEWVDSMDMLTEEEDNILPMNNDRWDLIERRVNDKLIELAEAEAKEKWLELFWLDCYEHSGISFSLAGEGMQCRFDTSGKCGFIIAESEEQARAEIKEYNQYINWECYWVDVSSRDIIEKGDKTFYSDWEFIDSMSCIGWENLEAPSQFPFEEGEWDNFIN